MTTKKIKAKKPQNAVDRLIHSLESRMATYRKNVAAIDADYHEKRKVQLMKIADCELQLRALKKK